MSIESSREREDQILEDELASGDITAKDYNEQMAELDRDQQQYEQKKDEGKDEYFLHGYC